MHAHSKILPAVIFFSVLFTAQFSYHAHTQTLEVRDAVMYLSRQHNRNKPFALKLFVGLGSQIPIQDMASASDKTNRNSTFPFETRAAWFYELKLSLGILSSIELFGLVHMGLWELESLVIPTAFRSHTINMTMFGLGGGAKYKILSGDFVPYIAGFGGMAPTTITLKQNFAPLTEDELSITPIFFGGALGLDLYISRHFGVNFEASFMYYTNTPDPGDLGAAIAFTHDPQFLDALSNIMLHTSIFYEF